MFTFRTQRNRMARQVIAYWHRIGKGHTIRTTDLRGVLRAHWHYRRRGF